MKFSIIVPIYRRAKELSDLLHSLSIQKLKNFEILIIEDGDGVKKTKEIIDSFKKKINIKYHFLEAGPSKKRNLGSKYAEGEYLIFFDSDCIIPDDYFYKLEAYLKERELDIFGGNDSAHKSFSYIQKSINYSMTSFITTGGIRGNKNNKKFQPRSFNMGVKKDVFEKLGGFSDIHPGEDPDLSIRGIKEGFKVGFIPDIPVYHKRRIDFIKFSKQVYKFGLVRVILLKWYPETSSIKLFLPSLFIVFSILSLLFSFFNYISMIPLILVCTTIFIDAIIKTKNIIISLLSIASTFIQLYSYGFGFLKSYLYIHIFKNNEKEKFPHLFY